MHTFKPLVTSFMLVLLLIAGTVTSDGKGSSSSGGRSSSSSSSSSSRSSSGWGSSSSSKPSSSWGSSSSSSSNSKPSSSWGSSSSSSSNSKPSSSWGSSSSSTPKPKLSSFAAAQSKEKLLPKEDYISKFKQENASKYKTTFDTEPTSRPSYIPPSYNNQTIVFNSATRGYGYYDALGTFILYDALTHAATSDYGTYHTYHTMVAAERPYINVWGWVIGFLVVIGILALIARSSSYY